MQNESFFRKNTIKEDILLKQNIIFPSFLFLYIYIYNI